ncbi:MAG: DNA methyltransferase, partial [Acetobacteraceae bacterium]
FTTSGRGRIDYLWKGNVLVEHKSRGEDLDHAAGQARDYFPGLKDAELPKFVIVSDFHRLRLYDLEAGTAEEFHIDELPQRISLFGFISGYTTRRYGTLRPVDLEASQRLGDLHDLLEDDGFGGRDLDVWMVRVLFCLFADRAGIFETGAFRTLIETRTAEDGSDLGAWLSRVHRVLATPAAGRQHSLDEALAALPYVNGRLFDDPVEQPETNSRMREALLACCSVDWSRVSPAIFGSLFQSIKDRDERRRGGEFYTTEANILKCLDSLFLDGLRQQLDAAGSHHGRLDAFLQRLRRVRVFDPACGCGNFLVVAYRELRRLQLAALRRRYGGDDAGQLAGVILSQVNVDQMFGIEIGDWSAQIAQVALWLTDHQMNMELSGEFGSLRMRLPLTTAPNILMENALRLDWSAILRPGADAFCVGNPPFSGSKFTSPGQRQDVIAVFQGTRNARVLDYVACWYRKAAEWMAGDDRSECCFVSTSSITQGEQPAVLWADLWPRRVVINFAHRTFRWLSEARNPAAVHCVIIGFALKERRNKQLFDYARGNDEPHALSVAQINPYLADGPMLALKNRRSALCDVPEMAIGSKPIDGGWYLFTPEEKAEFVADEPGAAPFFRRWIGSDEFLYGTERWFLWLCDAEPEIIRKLPLVRQRIEAVRRFRRGEEPGKNGRWARDAATAELARTPTRLHVENVPARRYLAVPEVSSETREYIPMAFVPRNVLSSNLIKIVDGATAYHFGILSSRMHMAWVRAVCGRLESRFRYSSGIVYNNFPWPSSSAG